MENQGFSSEGVVMNAPVGSGFGAVAEDHEHMARKSRTSVTSRTKGDRY